MLWGRDRGCHGAELGIQRQNREPGDVVGRCWGCQGCTAQCRECRGSKGRIVDPGDAMGWCWGCKGQCRGCRGAVPRMLQGRSGDAAGQSKGYCRAEPGIPGQSRGFQGRAGNARTDAGVPGMPWGSIRDAGGILQGSAGDVSGQTWGFRGCHGAVPGMQESAPGIKSGDLGDAVGQRRGCRSQCQGCRGCRRADPRVPGQTRGC